MESTSDASADEAKPESTVVIVHRDRVGADPTEGWRRGTRGELRKSCDTCTASKTKCCGDIPCDRCKKRGLECKFSKRRRCGPKARQSDEKDDKRQRTGTFHDSDRDRDSGDMSSGSSYAPHYREKSPPPAVSASVRLSHATAKSTMTTPTTASLALSGSNSQNPMHHRMNGPISAIPASRTGRALGAFSAPLTADGLSGLVELITPSISDVGGSGSSGTGVRSDSSAFSGPHESTHHENQNVTALSSFLGGTSPTRLGRARPIVSSNGMSMEHHRGTDSGLVEANITNGPISQHQTESARESPASLSSFVTANSTSKLPGGDLLYTKHRLRDSAAGTSAPAPAAMGRVTSSISDFGEGGDGFPGAAQLRVEWPGTDNVGAVGAGSQAAMVRGPLPMEKLPARARAHLSTFLRTLGSLLPLPGTEVLREALEQWGGDGDAGGDEMDSLPAAATTGVGGFPSARSSGRRRTRQHPRRNSGAMEDPMDEVDDDTLRVTAGANKRSYAPPKQKPGGGGGPKENSPSPRASARGGEEGSGNLELDEACRAEAWAAVAVGALFSGAGEVEAREYAAFSLRAVSRCLDAPLPEVASVFLLHALFWLHSMDRRKVVRYFGFAQQIGVELGVLLPEELRHSIAFFSVLVSMTVDTDQAASLGVRVRDPASWNISSSLRSGASQLGRLAAVIVACSKMLKDQEGVCDDPFEAVNRAALPKILPSQALTDLLGAAAEPLAKAGAKDSHLPTDHLLALLSGLKGYTHARRGETAKAEASARQTLEAFGRDRDMVHLPLTQTLVDASNRILDKSSWRVGGGGGGEDGRIWCPFGRELLRAAGSDVSGGDPESKINNASRGPPTPRRRSPTNKTDRGDSMSPPPGRTAGVGLSRAEVASQAWIPSGGGSDANGRSSAYILLSPDTPSHPSTVHRASSLPAPLSTSSSSRWPLSTTGSSSTIEAGRNPAATSADDWVERVRTLNSRTPSPAIVHRRPAGGRSPSAPDRGSADRRRGTGSVGACGSNTSSGLTLGPMPASTPLPRPRYASEPIQGLPFLSGVAGPGTSYPTRGYMSHEPIKTEKETLERRGGKGGGVGHYGGGEAEELGDDPPPSAPIIMSHQSFDPNREDTSLHDMLFHNRE